MVTAAFRIRVIGFGKDGNDFLEAFQVMVHAVHHFPVGKGGIRNTGGKICYHGNGRIADFRLSGQYTFRQICHAHHISSPLTVSLDFSRCFKTGTFSADIGSMGMKSNMLSFCRPDDGLAKGLAVRMGHIHMGHPIMLSVIEGSFP